MCISVLAAKRQRPPLIRVRDALRADCQVRAGVCSPRPKVQPCTESSLTPTKSIPTKIR